MNLKKEIFERISSIEKVELSETKKVELSIKDDASKLVTSYYGLTDTVNSKYTGILKEVRTLIDKIDETVKLSNEMPAIISKYEQLANELGIDINNIQELKDMKLAIKDVAQYKALSNKLKSI